MSTQPLPDVFRNLPIHWQGNDGSTPAGCTLVCTEVVGLVTTYVLRDGQIIGRLETAGCCWNAYAGSTLKGGAYVGSTGTFYGLAQQIADRASAEASR